MNLSAGGFWGKETVEAGCTAYSSCKHFLISSLVRIKGLQLSDLLLITQTQARHTRSSVSVHAVPGWAVLSTCPQEAHTPEEGAEPAQANPQGTGRRGEYHCFQAGVASSSWD